AGGSWPRRRARAPPRPYCPDCKLAACSRCSARSQHAQVAADVRAGDEGRVGAVLGDPATTDEQEPLADLAQNIELVGRGRMQADEHQASLTAQLAEEVQHETDIAVLRVE